MAGWMWKSCSSQMAEFLRCQIFERLARRSLVTSLCRFWDRFLVADTSLGEVNFAFCFWARLGKFLVRRFFAAVVETGKGSRTNSKVSRYLLRGGNCNYWSGKRIG